MPATPFAALSDPAARRGPPGGTQTGDASRGDEGDGTVASRRCGRCLAMFPGDESLDSAARSEWWLCAPCRLALLGPSRSRPADGGARDR